MLANRYALYIHRPCVTAGIRCQPRYFITQKDTQYSAMALTDTRVQTLTTGNRSERLIADTNGLYLRLRKGKGGITRTWQFRRREGDKLSVITLDTYPKLSLKEARLRAAELGARRDLACPTVTEAAEQWLAERVNTTHRRAFLVEGYIRRGVLPALGSRRLRDVAPAAIGKMIREYRDQAAKAGRARTEGRSAARALLATCKGLFGYAVACGWIDDSPAAQITAAIVGSPDAARARVLTDDEIKFVMATESPGAPLLRFLLATGLRLGEAYGGHRDGQHWVVPASLSKNGKEHRVWLSRVALAQLDHFPWAARRERVQGWLTENAGGWTCHDLRRTFSTRLNGMGTAPDVVERLLNHSLPGLMAVYNRAEYDAERREALEAWSGYLIGFVGEPAGENIVPLRAKAPQAA
jgi:integrase